MHITCLKYPQFLTINFILSRNFTMYVFIRSRNFWWGTSNTNQKNIFLFTARMGIIVQDTWLSIILCGQRQYLSLRSDGCWFFFWISWNRICLFSEHGCFCGRRSTYLLKHARRGFTNQTTLMPCIGFIMRWNQRLLFALQPQSGKDLLILIWTAMQCQMMMTMTMEIRQSLLRYVRVCMVCACL